MVLFDDGKICNKKWTPKSFHRNILSRYARRPDLIDYMTPVGFLESKSFKWFLDENMCTYLVALPANKIRESPSYISLSMYFLNALAVYQGL